MIQQIPRLALISSFAGFGRISISAALPVISVMQVQACPLPTAVLSSHLAYSPCHKADFTEHIPKILSAWEGIGLEFDGLYLGYISTPEQLDILKPLLGGTPEDSAHPYENRPSILKSHAKVIIDPVMGDHGKTYSTVTPALIEKMKQIICNADLITPNLTEACILADVPYHSEAWSEEELYDLCKILDPARKMQIVITGIREKEMFCNFLWDKGITVTHQIPSAGTSRPGTGDIFAAVLSANIVKGKPLLPSVRQACDFISACIRDCEEADTPVKEGILFEQNLSRLI